ncbi:hypothetical protein ABIC65_001867 [Sphingomonas trueperi]|uniref:hypothetical protein n=1 Tax=Sphingomonas trueperi TaxID=53317 RepID=UPI0033980E0F
MKTCSIAATLLLLAPLAACNSPQADDNAVTANVASPVVATPSPTPTPSTAPVTKDETPPHSAAKQCRFEVDGKTLLDGRCQVYPMGDGGYTLNTWSAGKPVQSHFAVVTTRADGKADATWNADPNDDKAGDPLGTVTRKDGCWVNQRTRICAR